MQILCFTTMYFALYISVSILATFLGWRVYQLHKNISGLFFLIFTLFACLWLTFYFLFFAEIFTSYTILLYLSRVNFIIGISAVYSLLFFILHFNQSRIYTIAIYAIGTILFTAYFCIFTDSIIATIQFSESDNVYREIYGPYYPVVIVYYIVFLLALLGIGWYKIKQESNLGKIRLKKILQSAYTLLALLIFLQVFLPIFDIWILEKELIFFYFLFVIYTYQTLRRYYFGSIGYGVSQGIIFMTALSIATSIYILEVFLDRSGFSVGGFWGFDDSFGVSYVIISIGVFYMSFEFLDYFFARRRHNKSLREDIARPQEEIIPIVEFDSINKKLDTYLNTVLTTSSTGMILFAKEGEISHPSLRAYFEYGYSDNIYIHDIVFQEERCSSLDIASLVAEIPVGAFLIFPIMRDGICIGIVSLGVKILGDFYTQSEISILRNFVYFLSSHIRYIETYRELRDITLHLDKRVDNKTIAYNNLINRQKEFIAVISHEIKSPISSAIFQSDSIIEDVENNILTGDQLKSELHILNTQLLRTGGLISKLFSVQYYDTHEVELFRERIEFAVFLQDEIDLFGHLHDSIKIISEIDPTIGFIDIDKIQFQQVLGNLLDNASKFLEIGSSLIFIRAYVYGGNLHISIEDSGIGFQGVDIENIFDKYRTGSQGMIGLGMGLYLCRKIISMHGGTIVAMQSLDYGGARFDISLPVA